MEDVRGFEIEWDRNHVDGGTTAYATMKHIAN